MKLQIIISILLLSLPDRSCGFMSKGKTRRYSLHRGLNDNFHRMLRNSMVPTHETNTTSNDCTPGRETIASQYTTSNNRRRIISLILGTFSTPAWALLPIDAFAEDEPLECQNGGIISGMW